MNRVLMAVAIFFSTVFAKTPCVLEAGDIDFNRDVRPILSDNCFACHGPDAVNQESEFRLDSLENATLDLGGYFGIVAGKPLESELLKRVGSPDDDMMPPPDSNRTLTAGQKQILRAWIQQGAKYDKHWSFVPPQRPPLPKLSSVHRDWAKNAIDYFIAARLEKEMLSARREASMELLLRRASLTLTGLLPTPAAMDVATAERKSQAYSQFVDRLLDSTDYAERQALRWLDAARYADTDGYQIDSERENWPWRDWVIAAYARNMPFDDFTIEQLAGDMLPNANGQQILATAFNRNHRQNSEGGALAAEYFVENVIDRVETTSTVWLGLTMGCARCHDHKFDPLSQREFFQMFAYFNNIGERGIGKGLTANPTAHFRSPLIKIPTDVEQELAASQRALAVAREGLTRRQNAWATKVTSELKVDGHDEWIAANVQSADADNGVTLSRLDDDTWLADGEKTTNTGYTVVLQAEGRVTGLSIDALMHESLSKPRQLAPSVNGNFVLSEIAMTTRNAKAKSTVEVSLESAEASFEQPGYSAANVLDGRPETGWAVFTNNAADAATPVSLFLTFATPLDLDDGSTIEVHMRHQSQFSDHHIGRFRINLTRRQPPNGPRHSQLPGSIVKILQTSAVERNADQKRTLKQHYQGIDPPLKSAQRRLEAVQKELQKIGAMEVPVMVMREKVGDPQPAFLLNRGQYDAPDKSEVLPRAVMAAILPTEDSSPPADRLELARWIVSRDNPLTARVIVNRIWQDHFGMGLVKTVEDFGSQGEYPSHPELLDWLAVEFIESDWDVKALHRLIVTSATYRQNSRVTPELISRDPENRLLARGPRYRMDGFSIRDNALQAAGLLDNRAGGPPVKPYQPQGLWNAVSSSAGTRYTPGKGRDLYRKSIYTYWKRAVNPPRQLIFDASGREACNVYVRRTNTPLQALVLMNDKTFIEAARHVAERVPGERTGTSQRLEHIYRLSTARRPTPERMTVLRESLAYFRQHYVNNTDDAEALLQTGESPRRSTRPAAEDAAWTAVAHLILNLDETITVE